MRALATLALALVALAVLAFGPGPAHRSLDPTSPQPWIRCVGLTWQECK